MIITFIFFTLIYLVQSNPIDDLNTKLQNLRNSHNLMGIQLKITQVQGQTSNLLYQNSFGNKSKTEKLQNKTMFRVASLSKSFSGLGLLQLAEKGKISLNQSISKYLGYQVKSPFFPNTDITVQMILTHQSSFVECQPYYSNFLAGVANAKDGSTVPNLNQILLPGGKYYNSCLYSSLHEPGSYFSYVNLNFGIAGTIIEAVSGERFDQYMNNHILKELGEGTSNTPTFNAGDIENPSDLGTIFVGSRGQWTPNFDYYSDGVIPKRNMTGYKVGTNGVVFSPAGGLRASVNHLANYMEMFLRKGKIKTQILSSSSVLEMFKPRYQYHRSNGPLNDFHLYGLGLYSTTYLKNDKVIEHEVAQGHLGAAYGLISAYFMWKNYTFSYIINGALNGYKYGTGTIYEQERLIIHESVDSFVKEIAKKEIVDQ